MVSANGTVVKIFTKVILKQPRSYEPKREILVDFIGVPTVKREAVSDVSENVSYRQSAGSIPEIRW